MSADAVRVPSDSNVCDDSFAVRTDLKAKGTTPWEPRPCARCCTSQADALRSHPSDASVGVEDARTSLSHGRI